MAAKQGKQGANDFQAAIDQAREKKKHETLAAKIFGRTNSPSTSINRRSSAPAAGGSLASRVGVKKNRAPLSGPRAAQPKANLQPASRSNTSSARPNSLAARISDPSRPQPSPPTGPKPKAQQRRAAQVAQALIRTELQHNNNNHHASPPAHNTQGGGGFNKGLSIRGLAGPSVVMAQNFAPGTTAADIESAMTPVGGLVVSCRLLKTSPIVIAEIVFESKEGADAVIARFNNQTADGRLLHVYHKVGGSSAPIPAARSAPAPPPPSAPRAQRERDDMVIDGSMGFDGPEEPRYVIDTQGARGSDSYRPSGGLYSDRIVPGRRGRGHGGGGRGRGR